MAKITVTARAVPKLKLTEHDEEELRALSEQLQHELLRQYEEFLVDRQVDASRWKLVKTQGLVHAYYEKKCVDRHVMEIVRTTQTKQLQASPQRKMAHEVKQSRVLVTGLVVGTVEDAMYGATFQDTPTLQGFWATQPLSMKQSAVVASTDQASYDDPFRFAGVTWSLQPSSIRDGHKHSRDYLSLVDIRSSALSSSERVGVVISHSIRHRDLTEMRQFGTIRGSASILTVFRQFDKRFVEVWSLQIVDSMRNQVDQIERAISFCSSAPMVGFRKKLGWLRQRRRLTYVNASDAIEPSASGHNGDCEVCSRPTSVLFVRHGASCQICWKKVCGRCNVPQEVVARDAGSKPSRKRIDVCVQCILTTKTLSAKAVARDELVAVGCLTLNN